MDVEIPDKTYFKIGEAADIVGVKPYIIRYWEGEFRGLRPAKTKSRQRLFRRKDIQLLLVIKTLLYDHKFTIEGARHRLKELSADGLEVERMLDAVHQPPAFGTAAASDDEVRERLEAALARIAALERDNEELRATAALVDQHRDTARRNEAERDILQQKLDALRTSRDADAQIANAQLAEERDDARKRLAEAEDDLERLRGAQRTALRRLQLLRAEMSDRWSTVLEVVQEDA